MVPLENGLLSIFSIWGRGRGGDGNLSESQYSTSRIGNNGDGMFYRSERKRRRFVFFG